MTQRVRCTWAQNDPLMQHYHDTEWGVPQRNGRALWEMLMLEGFQAGLAWITVLRKRDAFRDAFANFDPQIVAAYDEADIERLMQNAAIIRSRAKIEATIAGARIFLQIEQSNQNFADLCWSFTDGQTVIGDGITIQASTPLSERAAKTFKALGFKFVGPTIVHAWMQAVGIVNDHAHDCFRRDA